MSLDLIDRDIANFSRPLLNGREDLHALTLLEFAKCWEVRGDSLRRRIRAAERAVNVFPRFDRNLFQKR